MPRTCDYLASMAPVPETGRCLPSPPRRPPAARWPVAVAVAGNWDKGLQGGPEASRGAFGPRIVRRVAGRRGGPGTRARDRVLRVDPRLGYYRRRGLCPNGTFFSEIGASAPTVLGEPFIGGHSPCRRPARTLTCCSTAPRRATGRLGTAAGPAPHPTPAHGGPPARSPPDRPGRPVRRGPGGAGRGRPPAGRLPARAAAAVLPLAAANRLGAAGQAPPPAHGRPTERRA